MDQSKFLKLKTELQKPERQKPPQGRSLSPWPQQVTKTKA
jgi:hypothetical protein